MLPTKANLMAPVRFYPGSCRTVRPIRDNKVCHGIFAMQQPPFIGGLWESRMLCVSRLVNKG